MEITARPSSDRTTALTQSKQQQIGWLAQQVAIAKAYFPAAELTPEVAEVYMIELAEVATAVGAERAETALRTACRGSKFFPSVSEIRDCAGLNPQKLLAVAQDRAWRLARKYGQKWVTGVKHSAGFRADVNEMYEAECCWIGKGLPLRIAYAVEQAGGFAALRMDNPKDLSFTRQSFDGGYERFPMSEHASDDTLDPFAGGVTDDELLAGVVVDAKNKPLPEGVELLSSADHRKRVTERLRVEREEYLRTRTPEQAAEDEKREAVLRRLFPQKAQDVKEAVTA